MASSSKKTPAKTKNRDAPPDDMTAVLQGQRGLVKETSRINDDLNVVKMQLLRQQEAEGGLGQGVVQALAADVAKVSEDVAGMKRGFEQLSANMTELAQLLKKTSRPPKGDKPPKKTRPAVSAALMNGKEVVRAFETSERDISRFVADGAGVAYDVKYFLSTPKFLGDIIRLLPADPPCYVDFTPLNNAIRDKANEWVRNVATNVTPDIKSSGFGRDTINVVRIIKVEEDLRFESDERVPGDKQLSFDFVVLEQVHNLLYSAKLGITGHGVLAALARLGPHHDRKLAVKHFEDSVQSLLKDIVEWREGLGDEFVPPLVTCAKETFVAQYPSQVSRAQCFIGNKEVTAKCLPLLRILSHMITINVVENKKLTTYSLDTVRQAVKTLVQKLNEEGKLLAESE